MPKNDNDLSRFWYVHPKDLVTTQSMLYHENSKFGEFRVRFGSEDPKRAEVDPRIRSRLSDRELVTIVRMEEARDYRVYGDSEEE